MLAKNRIKMSFVFIALIATTVLLFGCGKQQQQGAAETPVKVMEAIGQDTPLSFEYAGTVVGTNEVKVQSRVSGSIVAKYIHGGEEVTAWQPLYKIDDGVYVSALNQARGALAQTQAQLSNAQQDLARYTQLINSGAISDQMYTNQQQTVAAYQAAVEASMAQVNKAQKDYNDTVVCAPISGRLDVNDVAEGVYAAAGNTVLVSLGAVNPVYVQFNISENEYLKFNQVFNGNFIGKAIQLKLSDGSEYPVIGNIAQVDRSMGNNTGTLTVKALFDNPNTLLLPGMFARAKLTGETLIGAVLIPQRAVQQLLDKSIVMVVDNDNKSAARVVKLGSKIGGYQIIEDGIKPGDKVIVEGLTKLREGMPLNVTMVTAEQLGISFESGSDSGSNGNSSSNSAQNK